MYPSRYEGFGLPVLEAMACECPAITSTASSLPEVGGDAVLYIELGPTEEDQTFELLQRVQRPEVRADLVARGLVQARKFSWRTMADGVCATLAAAADARPAPAPRVTPAAVAPSDQLVALGSLRCRVPASHSLAGLKREHRLYDRFTGSLAAVLDDGDAVVVAGAGYGTSVAALADARPALNLLAVERDATRFAYLRTNTAGWRAGGASLLHAELGSPALPDIDAAVREASLDGVRLVISSMGAGGADVLGGASALCAASLPMLHFTCQVGSDAEAWRAAPALAVVVRLCGVLDVRQLRQPPVRSDAAARARPVARFAGAAERAAGVADVLLLRRAGVRRSRCRAGGAGRGVAYPLRRRRCCVKRASAFGQWLLGRERQRLAGSPVVLFARLQSRHDGGEGQDQEGKAAHPAMLRTDGAGFERASRKLSNRRVAADWQRPLRGKLNADARKP